MNFLQINRLKHRALGTQPSEVRCVINILRIERLVLMKHFMPRSVCQVVWFELIMMTEQDHSQLKRTELKNLQLSIKTYKATRI